MAQYTTTAFLWSGTGYNAQYNTSSSVTFDDDDANLDGGSDPDETVSVDGGAFNATTGPSYNIDVSFTDTNGDSHVETFHFFNTDGSWYFVPEADSAFTVGATLGSYQSHTSSATPFASIACFVRGTLIETERGLVAVEDLTEGVKVLTEDGLYQALRLSLSQRLDAGKIQKNPKLAPVRIMAGAMGHGLPTRDLLVSRQHRMLVASKISERMFGAPEALVSAINLTEIPGVFVESAGNDVEYFHLIFDEHVVIYAEGAPSESFYPGPEGLRSLPTDAREEFLAIFPDFAVEDYSPTPAFEIPTGKRQRKLVARHLKNNQPFI